jgi:hypothetical protein
MKIRPVGVSCPIRTDRRTQWSWQSLSAILRPHLKCAVTLWISPVTCTVTVWTLYGVFLYRSLLYLLYVLLLSFKTGAHDRVSIIICRVHLYKWDWWGIFDKQAFSSNEYERQNANAFSGDSVCTFPALCVCANGSRCRAHRTRDLCFAGETR